MTCDEVFASYLKEVSEYTNQSYFNKVVLPFVVVLREFLNLVGPEYKKMLLDFKVINSVELQTEYCSFYSPEDIPELSNDFFNFLNIEEKFFKGFDMTEDKFIEEFMTFTSWMFQEDFISYRLFLVG